MSSFPAPPPVSIPGPNPDILVDFQLLYPSLGPVTDSVTLRAPNLGNRDRLSFSRILRETRGGTLVVYADPIWPKIQTLALTFSNLKRVQARALQDFLKNHLGQEIGLIDWEKRYWVGVITTPDEPVVEDSRDSYSASLEFQGELAAWNPQIVPGTTCAPSSRQPKAPAGRYSPCNCPDETGGTPPDPAGGIEPYTAEADAGLLVGHAVYLTIQGHLALAQAHTVASAACAGLAWANCDAGVAGKYVSEGEITRADWTAITGTPELVVGANYFLSATNAGQLTTVAPTTPGQYVARVGRAISPVSLDLEIGMPIRL